MCDVAEGGLVGACFPGCGVCALAARPEVRVELRCEARGECVGDELCASNARRLCQNIASLYALLLGHVWRQQGPRPAFVPALLSEMPLAFKRASFSVAALLSRQELAVWLVSSAAAVTEGRCDPDTELLYCTGPSTGVTWRWCREGRDAGTCTGAAAYWSALVGRAYRAAVGTPGVVYELLEAGDEVRNAGVAVFNMHGAAHFREWAEAVFGGAASRRTTRGT